jgi:hypothetical protein
MFFTAKFVSYFYRFCMCRKMINWWKRYMYHTNQTEWSKMPRWEKDYNLQVPVTVV